MGQMHEVKEGECLSSIAFAYGFFVDTIWNHPANEGLKKLRKDPMVLKAGDQVVIPDKGGKEVALQSGASYTFRRKGVPALFKVRLVQGSNPRADLPYVLEVDGKRYRGRTDSDGVIQQVISPMAISAELILGDGTEEERYHFLLGHIDPIDDLSGVQARLRNLGFYAGAVDGQPGERTTAAVHAFQKHHGLNVTGELDSATREKLVQEFGG